MQVLESALLYASKGWRVFPVHSIDEHGKCTCGENCKSPGKHPVLTNGLNGASSDPQKIKGWFKNAPWANIAIRTGAESGLWAIDLDPEKGGYESFKAFVADRDVGAPLVSNTGGGGTHLLFEAPEGVSIVTRTNVHGLSGVDIRGQGGYIVAPPSQHLKGVYHWGAPLDKLALYKAPDWLASKFQAQPDVAEQANSIPAAAGPGFRYMLQSEKDEIFSALEHIDSYERETWLRVGMALHSIDSGEDGYKAWCWWSQLGSGAEKYDENDQMRTWKAFRSKNGQVNKETIFFMAQNAGWENPLHSCLEQSESASEAPDDESCVIASRDEPAHPGSPPGILSTVIDYILKTAPRPQPVFALNAALCMAGTVMGQKVCSETGLRTNLYLLSIGPSGSGKDHPRKAIGRILSEANLFHLIGGEEFSSGSAILSMLAAGNVRVSQLDEFGKMLSEAVAATGSHKASIIRRLMTLFSSADAIVPGQEMSSLSARKKDEVAERKDIHYPHLSLHMTTVLSELLPALSSADVFSGFLNRILISVAKNERPKLSLSSSHAPVPQEVLRWIFDVRNPRYKPGSTDLSGFIDSAPRVIKFSMPAASVIEQFRDFTYEREIEGESSGTDALWGRATEHAIKMSMIAEVSTNPAAEYISQESALWGAGFVNYATWEAEQLVKHHVSDSAFEGQVKAVYMKIKAAGDKGISRRALRRQSPLRSMRPRDQTEVFAALSSYSVEEFPDPKQVGPGRPRVLFRAV